MQMHASIQLNLSFNMLRKHYGSSVFGIMLLPTSSQYQRYPQKKQNKINSQFQNFPYSSTKFDLVNPNLLFPPKKTSLYWHPPSYFAYHCRKKKPPPKRHCDEGMQSCDTRPDPMELSQLWFSLGEVQKPYNFQVM